MASISVPCGTFSSNTIIVIIMARTPSLKAFNLLLFILGFFENLIYKFNSSFKLKKYNSIRELLILYEIEKI